MAKKYEELTFNDDFMFCKILEQKPALCRELLELVLDRKVGELVGVNPQKPIEITANGKGVRFDVYAEGSDSIIYDIEMQNASTDSIAKRSRYSQGMIDLNLIKRGAHYSDLNRSYVIYICRFNLFEEIGRHKYSFLNLCQEDPRIELGDETEKIFLCAKGTVNDVSEKLQAFLNYIASGMPSDGFTNELENEVQKARDHIQWRTEYMTFLEQLERERNEGREEGRKEGLEEGRAEERVNTERERERADAAENRAEAAEDRAEAAEDRANGLEKEVLELRKQLESLIHK
jgi:predicted transposase/invertase (TIGR01784 family)